MPNKIYIYCNIMDEIILKLKKKQNAVLYTENIFKL